jgi:hypothetical protein
MLVERNVKLFFPNVVGFGRLLFLVTAIKYVAKNFRYGYHLKSNIFSLDTQTYTSDVWLGTR